MADVFISYAREDRSQAEQLAERLIEAGLDVWLDIESLRLGASFASAIQQAVDDTRSVIVLWSVHSSASRWVRAEASLAWEQEKLCSVIIDQQTVVPFPYNTLHWLSLVGWDGSRESQVFQKLLRDLTDIVVSGGQTESGALRRRLGKSAAPTGSPAKPQGPSRKGPRQTTADGKPEKPDRAPGMPIPEMVQIQPGRFLMGEGNHEVRIDRVFTIGKYPVTFEQFDAFAEATGRVRPSDENWGRGRRPVINVSWDDAVAYTAWLSEQTGNRYRLPSEAEWEYAARAGTRTRWSFGDDESALGEHAWYSGNAGGKTHPVGESKPNPWGLHDVHGNVWEWVQDCWHDDYSGAPDDGTARESGDCDRRVLRGGAWGSDPGGLRSAIRNDERPAGRHSGVGFRVAQD